MSNLPQSLSWQDSLDYMHRRYYSPVTNRFMTFDPVMQTGRAKRKPGLWNRYSYALGNPINFIDPRGEDVSISVTFQDTGLTDEQKAEVLQAIADFWKKADVGKVYVFDSAKMNETNTSLFGLISDKGTASITVSGAVGTSKSDLAKVGDLLGDGRLTAAQLVQGVANRVNHELFVHQLKLGTHSGDDMLVFSRAFEGAAGPDIKGRYGTINDSHAFTDPNTREAALNGPLPIHAADRARAQQQLGGISLQPPSPRN